MVVLLILVIHSLLFIVALSFARAYARSARVTLARGERRWECTRRRWGVRGRTAVGSFLLLLTIISDARFSPSEQAERGGGAESTYTHPAHAAPTEHAVLIAHSAASSRALDGAATANLDALDPAVKAADDVARVRSLLQISAFQLIDIVLDDGQLLVQLALLLEGLAEGGSQ